MINDFLTVDFKLIKTIISKSSEFFNLIILFENVYDILEFKN